jgi:hypothetical protein
VKKVLYVILAATLVAALIPLATAQPLPPAHLYGNGAPIRLQSGAHQGSTTGLTCSPCLIYTGDNDVTSPNANGLFSFENPGIGITDAEVWTKVHATSTAVIKGASGNFYTTTTTIGTNPTPFKVRLKVAAGNAGTSKCDTNGNATVSAYGTPDFGLNSENYYIKKLAHGCKVASGKNIWVAILPQYNDGSTIGYLEDNDGAKANHQGPWTAPANKSFFNSSSFGVFFQNTSGSSGACGGIGCSSFSISLSGN